MSLRPSWKTEKRRNCFKVAVGAEEGRRRREKNIVEIRKNKRQESLLKKRRGGLESEQAASLVPLVSGVSSDDSNHQLEATRQFRKLVSLEDTHPIDGVVQSGVVPRFVEFLTREDFPELQLEAAWALKNIASGTSEHTKAVIEQGAVSIFVNMIACSPIEELRELAVWALGNIAGDSPQCRYFVLSNGALAPLLSQFDDNAKLSMIRNATWTLSNFCRDITEPLFDHLRPAIPVLHHLIRSSDDELVLIDACCALSFLSEGPNEHIQAVIEAGGPTGCVRFVELLLHPSPGVAGLALLVVGNIVTGDDDQTQSIINSGGLPCFTNLLASAHKKSIKKDTCWAISNVTAGNQRQIQAVIDSGLIDPVINLLQNAEFGVKKEAAWAISNAASGGTNEQIEFLVAHGCVKPLCDLLTCPDLRIIEMCLNGLEKILEVGAAETSVDHLYAQLIEEADGLEKIEALQTHDNEDIYEKAVRILETYFENEYDDDGDESHETGYGFGGNDEVQVPPGGFNFG